MQFRSNGMIKKIPLIYILAVFLFFIVPPVFSQMSSASYGITSGYTVGGGGSSSSAGYGVIGNFGFGPMGVSTSAGYSILGGALSSIDASAAFLVNYGTMSTIMITKVDREVFLTHENETGAVTGTFYHRFAGYSSFTDEPMSAGGAGELIFNLSADLITPRGLEYYIEVTDAGSGQTRYIGSAVDPYMFGSDLTNAQCQRPTAMPNAQYRIIGLPVDLAVSPEAELVFGDDFGAYDTRQWKMGRYMTGTVPAEYDEYPALGTIGRGLGYWLIVRGGKTYGVDGYSALRPGDYSSGGVDYYAIDLDEEWNMIANPFAFDVTWADVLINDNGDIKTLAEATSDGIIENAAYIYNGTDYEMATVLTAWDGFYFNLLDIGAVFVEMLIPYKERVTKSNAPKLTPIAIAENNWDINLRLTTNGLSDGLNYVGVKPDAQYGNDVNDFSEIPSAPGAASLAISIPGERGFFRTDYRPQFNDGASWDITFSNAESRVLTISGLSNIPESMKAWLIFSDESKMLLNENEAIELADEITSAELAIGTEQYLKNQHDVLVPTDFALNQNYPNPFNPTTTIRFALPEPADVTLEVFNILGQKVATIKKGRMTAGYHAETWNGTTDNGRPTASGVYFYRINANSFSEQKKMLLLK